jgi:hypothetical protein
MFRKIANRYNTDVMEPTLFVPLLAVQRAIYELPPGPERFQRYVETLRDDAEPLSAMNPMGKAHCPALLDEYLALDADSVGERALRNALTTLEPGAIPRRATLVLVDDLKGGWTNRTAHEYNRRVPEKVVADWLSVFLWTSEPPSVESVENAVKTALHRSAWLLRNGPPKTLRDVLAQERFAADWPPLVGEEREDAVQVIRPLLDTPATNMPIVVAALFGDEGAASLGYPPLRLKKNAGLRLASSVLLQD